MSPPPKKKRYSSSDSDIIMTDTSSKRLLSDGQEVYLCRGDYRIFKATVSSSYGNTVHGVSLDEDHGRFFITRLLQHSSKWDNFDCDIHCVGSAIRWRLSSVKTIKTDKFTDYGTEAQQPKTLEMRKRKRNTQEWKKLSEKNNTIPVMSMNIEPKQVKSKCDLVAVPLNKIATVV